MKFAEKLLYLRKKHGLSQEDLAEKLNVSRQAVSRWEMGNVIPDATNLLGMSKLFNVSIDYLLHDEYMSTQDIPVVKEEKRKVTHRFRKIITRLIIGFIGLMWMIALINHCVHLAIVYTLDLVILAALGYLLYLVIMALRKHTEKKGK